MNQKEATKLALSSMKAERELLLNCSCENCEMGGMMNCDCIRPKIPCEVAKRYILLAEATRTLKSSKPQQKGTRDE